jgi:hypothetical protein
VKELLQSIMIKCKQKENNLNKDYAKSLVDEINHRIQDSIHTSADKIRNKVMANKKRLLHT